AQFRVPGSGFRVFGTQFTVPHSEFQVPSSVRACGPSGNVRSGQTDWRDACPTPLTRNSELGTRNRVRRRAVPAAPSQVFRGCDSREFPLIVTSFSRRSGKIGAKNSKKRGRQTSRPMESLCALEVASLHGARSRKFLLRCRRMGFNAAHYEHLERNDSLLVLLDLALPHWH